MVSIGNFKSVQSMFSALSYYLTGRLVWAASLDMIHTCANAGQDRDAVNMWTFVPCNYSYSPCIPCASRMLPF